jgi:hypothetical protein
MSKQCPSLRALRSAAIALFLAARLEGRIRDVALSTFVAHPRRRCAGSVHFAGSQSTPLGRIDDLLVDNGPSGSSFRIYFGRAQVRTTGLAVTKTGKDAPGIRCWTIPKAGSDLMQRP